MACSRPGARQASPLVEVCNPRPPAPSARPSERADDDEGIDQPTPQSADRNERGSSRQPTPNEQIRKDLHQLVGGVEVADQFPPQRVEREAHRLAVELQPNRGVDRVLEQSSKPVSWCFAGQEP